MLPLIPTGISTGEKKPEHQNPQEAAPIQIKVALLVCVFNWISISIHIEFDKDYTKR